jgi:hypothetical protein
VSWGKYADGKINFWGGGEPRGYLSISFYEVLGTKIYFQS